MDERFLNLNALAEDEGVMDTGADRFAELMVHKDMPIIISYIDRQTASHPNLTKESHQV